MAEEEGFEPPRAVKPLSVFKTTELKVLNIITTLNNGGGGDRTPDLTGMNRTL